MTTEDNNPRDMTRSRKVLVACASLAVCVVAVLGVYFLATADSIPSYVPKYASELRLCRRVEIEYQPSALEYFEVLAANPGLLSSEEREHLQSLKMSVTSDPLRIKLMADVLSQMPQSVAARRKPDKPACLKVRGYREGACTLSFETYDHRFVVTDDGQTFEPLVRPDVASCLPELNSFPPRSICAQRLLSFARALDCGRGGARRCVVASEWCETIWPPEHSREKDIFGRAPSREALRRQLVKEKERNGEYRCPSAGEGRCHYAMNPACEPNSPPDMVLMFETKAGWNQHGGPELFTFDHHVPRGGCVLLNDGTVEFIRTEEELKKLRWK